MKTGSVVGTVCSISQVGFDRLTPFFTESGARTLLGLKGRDAGLTLGVDPENAMVWMHGGYWYQGEYLFEPHPRGTLVTYRIRNVSGQPDLFIRIWQRRRLKTQQTDLNRLVAGIMHRVTGPQ